MQQCHPANLNDDRFCFPFLCCLSQLNFPTVASINRGSCIAAGLIDEETPKSHQLVQLYKVICRYLKKKSKYNGRQWRSVRSGGLLLAHRQWLMKTKQFRIKCNRCRSATAHVNGSNANSVHRINLPGIKKSIGFFSTMFAEKKNLIAPSNSVNSSLSGTEAVSPTGECPAHAINKQKRLLSIRSMVDNRMCACA